METIFIVTGTINLSFFTFIYDLALVIVCVIMFFIIESLNGLINIKISLFYLSIMFLTLVKSYRITRRYLQNFNVSQRNNKIARY